MKKQILIKCAVIGSAISVFVTVMFYSQIVHSLTYLKTSERVFESKKCGIDIVVKTPDGEYLSDFIEINC